MLFDYRFLYLKKYKYLYKLKDYKSFRIAINCYENASIKAEMSQYSVKYYTSHLYDHINNVIMYVDKCCEIFCLSEEQKKYLEMIALFHDVGMDGDFLYVNELNKTRKRHALTSAIKVLGYREAIEKDGIDADIIATVCLLHSKSTSGVKDLSNNKYFFEDFETVDSNAFNFFDDTQIPTSEEDADNMTKEEYEEIYKEKEKLYEALKYTEKCIKTKIENIIIGSVEVKFNNEIFNDDNILKSIQLYAIIIRICDSIAHIHKRKKDSAFINLQCEKSIKIDYLQTNLADYSILSEKPNIDLYGSLYEDFGFFGNDEYRVADTDNKKENYVKAYRIDKNPYIELCEKEIENAKIISEFDDKSFDNKSKIIYFGEGNIKPVELSGENSNLIIKFNIISAYVPACTLKAIFEVLEEIYTFNKCVDKELINSISIIIDLQNICDLKIKDIYKKFISSVPVKQRYENVKFQLVE